MDEKKKSQENNNAINEMESSDSIEKLKYPKSVFFIIGNEFCERFSYYGMKAVLVLYFKNVFTFEDDDATLAYHLFSMLCYFTPVLGAIIADSFWGKYNTIFYISIVYAIGNIVLSISAGIEKLWITYIGLLLIALGTGGIKPCVAAFGGDQFRPGQENDLKRFFSFFYISINAGSLLSTALTPIFREDIECFNRKDCFPLAFGVPAILMVVALGLFIIGKFIANYRILPPAKGNIVVETVCVVFHALGRKMSPKTSKRDHWLDHADDKYDNQLITDVKALMRVLFLYLPIPIFWALFDQQGSRWTLQALKMNGDFFGVYRIKPDQVQVVNPILIIVMIPLFEYAIYPGLEKLGMKLTPLKRITIGGLLAAAAFIICAFFQLRIETDLPTLPSSGQTNLTIVNGLPCRIKLTNPHFSSLTLDPTQIGIVDTADISKLNLNKIIEFSAEPNECQEFSGNKTYYGTYKIPEDKDSDRIGLLLITEIDKDNNNVIIEKISTPQILEKPNNVSALVTIVYFGISPFDKKTKNFTLINDEKHVGFLPVTNYSGYGVTNIGDAEIKGDDYKLVLREIAKSDDKEEFNDTTITEGIHLKQGAGYIIVVKLNGDGNYTTMVNQIVKENSVIMLWQIIQYLVITAGEIMFSITGLEFSYAQAPKSMKSVLQAAWLLTVAFGNLIVVIIASAKFFETQSIEFFFFAGLMILDMAVFALMAWFYVPYKNQSEDSTPQPPSPYVNGSNGVNGLTEKQKSYSNNGFTDEDTTKF